MIGKKMSIAVVTRDVSYERTLTMEGAVEVWTGSDVCGTPSVSRCTIISDVGGTINGNKERSGH